MNAAPASTIELVIDWGTTGATIGARILDNQGVTTTARFEGFTEDPGGSGVYRNGAVTAPGESGQYTILYDDDAGVAAVGHVATEDLVVTANAPFDPPTGDTYASVDELARILKIRTPSAEQEEAMGRVLLAATGEIDSEIDLPDDEDLAGWQLALAQEVCLERAVEHWRQQESPFGLLGLGVEQGVAFASKDSWGRHGEKLAPLKSQWGLA